MALDGLNINEKHDAKKNMNPVRSGPHGRTDGHMKNNVCNEQRVTHMQTNIMPNMRTYYLHCPISNAKTRLLNSKPTKIANLLNSKFHILTTHHHG